MPNKMQYLFIVAVLMMLGPGTRFIEGHAGKENRLHSKFSNESPRVNYMTIGKRESSLANEIVTEKPPESSSEEGSVIIFTAWGKFKNLSHYKPRIDHHVAYTKRHGYKYVILLATADNALLGGDVEFIEVPGFLDRKDHSPYRRVLQTGWLKVDAFQVLLSRYSAPSLFFYVDMDVVFYNFGVPLTSVFHGKTQSIFAQESTPGRMFSPSHAVAIRHS
eukprot:CAMPEP_0114478282 /NCGR_PEP_ID=MMETSP0104-20121206/15895_1 /TAXON_ID=37642 ORGANISM="Paraphysomonas imperforata, Strain PA2" /NCGR_SAMPLE_ID=MMETSP0104 /ASSEMBLY_ACC=CAM_ASM_000202 /LENGTH=218 /DNA_ID=CAMNT_0001653449 /DNA_START=112 /DNA_END=766 /DNA_ORIENTATION=+